MKPKEQIFDNTDSYKSNLSDWIWAVACIPFTNTTVFKTYSATKELLDEEPRMLDKENNIIIETDLFDDQFVNTENKAIFIAEILPVQGRQDMDGIFATFNRNNEAFFEDIDYGNYQKYFEENGIEQGKKMTWQEAYDKLCELARNEQKSIPEFIEK